MLNQTNIGHNNNKYYVIQLIRKGQQYYVFTRWGRVGEDGSAMRYGPFTKLEKAESTFKKKFSDKTKNQWSDDIRDNFVPQNGKYTLLDMCGDEEDDDEPPAKKGTVTFGVGVRAEGPVTV